MLNNGCIKKNVVWCVHPKDVYKVNSDETFVVKACKGGMGVVLRDN